VNDKNVVDASDRTHSHRDVPVSGWQSAWVGNRVQK